MTLPRLKLRPVLRGLVGGLTAHIAGRLTRRLANRSLRRRSLAGLYTAAVIAALVLLNLAAARFPWRLDTTALHRFSLAPQTRQVLAGLPGEVKALGFFTAQEAGQQAYVEDLLREYQHHSGGKLTWSMADPSTSPSLARQHNVTRSGVTVLTYQGKTEQLDEWDMMGGTDPFTGQAQLNGEQALTNALVRLTAARTPRAYFLEGHGEQALWELPTQLRAEGYAQASLSFATQTEVPPDADVLVIAGPTRDLERREADLLERWMAEQGGRALVMLDPGRRLPVLEGWLQQWGVTPRNDVVVDPSRHYLYDATTAVPVYQEHPVTARLDTGRIAMVMPNVRSLALPERKDGYRYAPLLTTSADAWGETKLDGPARKDVQDTPGPLTLAVAVARENSGGSPGSAQARPEARLLVIGTSGFATDDALTLQGNLDFAMAGLGWLTDRQEAITIRARQDLKPPVFFTTGEATAILAGTVVLMPLLCLLAGGWVWQRRRHL